MATRTRSNHRRWFQPATAFLLLALFFYSTPAHAHAVLVQSSPCVNCAVDGGSIPIELRFNVRIDAKRSRVALVLPDKSQKLLSLTQPSPDTLSSEITHLAAGAYSLRWQVLASDGHITQGEIRFNVKT